MGHRLTQRRLNGEGTAWCPPTRATGDWCLGLIPVRTPHVWPSICISNKPPDDPDPRLSVSSRGARSLSFCVSYLDFRTLAWIFKRHCEAHSKQLWVNLAVCSWVLCLLGLGSDLSSATCALRALSLTPLNLRF